VVHGIGVNDMTEIPVGGPRKPRGRPPGAPNKVTRDIRAALRDLAEGNADRVQSWLDSVAEKDPAEALRLWLGLLRYVTPTLAATAVADLTPAKEVSQQLTAMSDEELMEYIVRSPEAAELVEQGVKTQDELLRRMAYGPSAKALPGPKAKRVPRQPIALSPDDEDLLR
jgi:hypothetical protein